ncbi:type I restriction-modification system subunit M/S [Streptomyces sp. NBC_00893]|uniref:N-6 DNA methylase n=1 Tax=Streptomyces sp. NBC_00893 TaxID=2975862 RepID=UPI00225271E0|nr:type I restriction-modification system subunit M/S [Streptomyces sp. NBC_00893]MCX4845647.1 N-6 DNA methylase [Streptomyces sp. NBC_00893]
MITEAVDPAAEVAERLWRAYAPYRRGRGTAGDLDAMLAILVLAAFVETEGRAEGDFVKRWKRASAEAAAGFSPVADLRGALQEAARRPGFPLLWSTDLDLGSGPDDGAWMTAFVAELDRGPSLGEVAVADVCELLLQRHAAEGALPGGEFYTPRGVADLLADLADPRSGDRIMDPACGAGSVLAAAARHLAERGPVADNSFEAYAVDRSNVRPAMLNLALHGVSVPQVELADPATLLRDRNLGRADRVLSNPPFNQRIDGWGSRQFIAPPESSANFAWLQLAWSQLKDGGVAAVVMPARAAWAGGAEARIRGEMVASGAVLAVIALPAHLFAGTNIAVHVWVLGRGHRPRATHRSDSVILVDARSVGGRSSERPRVLSGEDADHIADRFRRWLGTSEEVDEPGFCRSVAYAELIENAGNLDPRTYLRTESGSGGAADLSAMLADFERRNRETSELGAELTQIVGAQDQLVQDGIRCQNLLLKEVVSGGSAVGGRSVRLLAGPSGSLVRAQDYVEAGGVPVVMPKDISDIGFVEDGIKCISEQHAERLDRFRLNRGDIVVARRGDLGRCAVVGEEQQGWVCGTGCFVVSPPASVDSHYLAAFLRSPGAREWLDTHSTGSLALSTVSLEVLGMLPVALPDLDTQRSIGEAMTSFDAHERRLLEQLATMRDMRSKALNSFLAG